MAYMSVLFESEDILHLSRSPSLKAWAILGCLIACGFGAAFYSSDHIIWNLLYMSMAIFIGLSFMEDWEECICNKIENTVKIKQISVLQRFFQTQFGNRVVSCCLSEIISARVKEEMLHGSKANFVILVMSAGYDVSLTEIATFDDKLSHELIAQKICDFLNLTLSYEDLTSTPGTPDSNMSDTSSFSDESFEHVDPSELIDDMNECAPIDTIEKNIPFVMNHNIASNEADVSNEIGVTNEDKSLFSGNAEQADVS